MLVLVNDEEGMLAHDRAEDLVSLTGMQVGGVCGEYLFDVFGTVEHHQVVGIRRNAQGKHVTVAAGHRWEQPVAVTLEQHTLNSGRPSRTRWIRRSHGFLSTRGGLFKRLLYSNACLSRIMGTMQDPSADTGSKDRLRRAALHCIAQRGYAATSSRDIAREARANVASINYHFGSKEALVTEALGECFGMWNQRVEKA